MPVAHILLALFVAAVWGLSFIAIKLGVSTAPPLLLCALRFTFAAFPAVFFIKRPKVDGRLVAAYGFFLGVGQFGLLFAAMAVGMPASLASVVIQAQVFFTILMAVLIGERPGRHQALAGAVACLGLILIAVPRMTGGGLVPFLMTVAAASSWGVANIISKRAGRIDMLGFVVWASLVPPIPLLVLSFWLEGPRHIAETLTHVSGGVAGAVAYLAYPSTVFAFAAWSYLLSRYPAATVTPFALFVPVIGILSASFLLGERIVPIEAAGSAVILLGLAINVFAPRLMRVLRPLPAPNSSP